jgi:hypothetical protein
MTSSHRSADDASAEQVARSIRVGEQSARLIALSEAARDRLHALEISALPDAEADPDPIKATDSDLSQQMARCHVLVVNSDPAFLDAVRVLLQSNRYSVTSIFRESRAADLRHGAGGVRRRPGGRSGHGRAGAVGAGGPADCRRADAVAAGGLHRQR